MWRLGVILIGAFSLTVLASDHREKQDVHKCDPKDKSPHAILKLDLLGKKHYAPMPVLLDASKSHSAKETSITQYEFDFGDGTPKRFTDSSQVRHTFEILGKPSLLDKVFKKNEPNQKFMVTLRVQDSSGTWSKPMKKTLVLKQLPDPGEEGKKTLAGIDLNENGVRDDVELYIASEFANEKPVIREALRQFALDQLKILLSVENKEQNIVDNHESSKSQYCFLYLARINKGDLRADEKLGAAIVNTKERVLAAIQASKNFNGQSVRLPKGEEKLSGCKFNLGDF